MCSFFPFLNLKPQGSVFVCVHHLCQLLFELVVHFNVELLPRCSLVEEVKELTVPHIRTNEILHTKHILKYFK